MLRYKDFCYHQLYYFFVAISNNGRDLTVDFPQQPGWTGQVSEMELVTDQCKFIMLSNFIIKIISYICNL